MMDMLGIKQLRPAASHDPKSPNAVNYDESKADRYPGTLPDPLKLKNGKRVTSAKMWWTKRRPEIVEDFDREVLGRVPAQCARRALGGDEHDDGDAGRRGGGEKDAQGARGQFAVIPADRR